MATIQQGALVKALKQALGNLETQGREDTAASISPIVFENLERGGNPGRVQTNLAANPEITPCDYVGRVAEYYEALCGYLYQIQEQKSARVWEPLFEEMQWWAYNFLRRKDFSLSQQTFQMAKDCAASAGGELVQAYYPYDTDFDAWACVIVQNHCKKAIGQLLQAGHLPEHKLVSLSELPPNLARTADLGGEQHTQWRLTLMHLIEQLPAEEQETVLLYDYEGMTFSEIGQCLGISTTTAHRRYFSAIDFLRKNLT